MERVWARENYLNEKNCFTETGSLFVSNNQADGLEKEHFRDSTIWCRILGPRTWGIYLRMDQLKMKRRVQQSQNARTKNHRAHDCIWDIHPWRQLSWEPIGQTDHQLRQTSQGQWGDRATHQRCWLGIRLYNIDWRRAHWCGSGLKKE